jgi:phage tail-like protein
MAEPRVNHARFDRYKNFRFRVKWDGRYVAGFNKSAPLNGITKALEHREGTGRDASRQSPGGSTYEAVTLQRGITHDAEFEQWASTAWKLASARPRRSPLEGFRKDITIEVYDKMGNSLSRTRCSAAGCPSTRRCRTWTETQTQSRSSTSSSRMRDSSATTTCPSPPSRDEAARSRSTYAAAGCGLARTPRHRSADSAAARLDPHGLRSWFSGFWENEGDSP